MSTATLSRTRIYLSPPHMGEDERRHVEEAFTSNWVAPVGPHLDAFEAEMCAATGIAAGVCVASGTAALHLATRLVGVSAGDEVFCPTFTFIASATPVVYQGARPVFIDAELNSWNISPALLEQALADRARQGRLPRAIIVADIYGQCADWQPILELAQRYEVPVIEDAAEACGATYQGRAAGSFGRFGIFSFNGNKIINTSGGGMLMSHDKRLIDHARKLATQARDSGVHYEHSELGYNYRLSNVLAGIGRGQLKSLPARIARRWEIRRFYEETLGALPGVRFMPELAAGRSNAWLTCLTIDPELAGTNRTAVLDALAADNIEARPLWKPLHAQPLFRTACVFGGAVAEKLFADGLSLPSGSAMTDDDLQRVAAAVRAAFPGL